MQSPIHACFNGGGAPELPLSPTAAAEPAMTTSVYETRQGYATLTWSRAAFGLTLRVEIQLPSAGGIPPTSSSGSAFSSSGVSSSSTLSDCAAEITALQFQIRPWILWKRSGTKRLRVKEGLEGDQRPRRTVDVAWDLTRALFRGGRGGGGPEPSSGYFVSVMVDGELFVVVGDDVCGADKAVAKNRKPADYCVVRRLYPKGAPQNPVLVSRREHVVLPASATGSYARPYAARVPVGGTDREVALELSGRSGEKDARMSVVVDRKKVLRVKRLRWKFRGNERVSVDGNFGVQVSWDAHSWLFPKRAEVYDADTPAQGPVSAPAAAKLELGHMLFVLRFDGDVGDRSRDGSVDFPSSVAGYDDSSKEREPGLGKTPSSLSPSPLSTFAATSPSVMHWASVEENELKGSDGFSLLVYVWRR